MSLPPLPKPAMVINAKPHDPLMMWDAYTADQMREYAAACVSSTLGKPVAWMTEDGRVASDYTKRTAMHKAVADSYCIPLYRS